MRLLNQSYAPTSVREILGQRIATLTGPDHDGVVFHEKKRSCLEPVIGGDFSAAC